MKDGHDSVLSASGWFQVEMASKATILRGNTCSVCQAVLCPEPGYNFGPDPKLSYTTPAGQTLVAFRNASQEDCVICSTIFNMSEQHRLAWSDTSSKYWQPLQYRVQKYAGEEGIVRLNVIFSDPLRGSANDVRFRLIPIDSKPRLLLQKVYTLYLC